MQPLTAGNIVLMALLSCRVLACAQSRDVADLTITVFVPLTAEDYDGRPLLPAVDVTLDLVNNRSDMLPGYRLNYVAADSAVSTHKKTF